MQAKLIKRRRPASRPAALHGMTLALLVIAAAAIARPAAAIGEADYVGGETCRGCHEPQASLWRGSHHDLAMQHATEATVLGDFDDADLAYAGVTSTFFRRGERFFVRTDGADSELAEFEILYTFGVDPLQQYLVELPGGRRQALTIAWDTRPADLGGQRWFHLYPG